MMNPFDVDNLIAIIKKVGLYAKVGGPGYLEIVSAV